MANGPDGQTRSAVAATLPVVLQSIESGGYRPGLFQQYIAQLLKVQPAADPQARLKEIQTLDPVRDCVRIQHLFHEDFQALNLFRSLDVLLWTYSNRPISRVLSQSRQFQHFLLKRMVDTLLLTRTLNTQGFETGAGREAIRRINQMHRRYNITARDFAAVSCSEVYQHLWYSEQYGWRPVTEQERIGLVQFQVLRSRYMGYSGVPDTVEGMKQFFLEYNNENLAIEPQNSALAKVLIPFMLQGFPEALRPVIEGMVFCGGVDSRLITYCGFELPAPAKQELYRKLLVEYGRLDPMVDGPSEGTKAMVKAVYPDGYELSQLGTHVGQQPS